MATNGLSIDYWQACRYRFQLEPDHLCKVIKAINTHEMDDAPAIMEQRRIAWVILKEECESLKEKARI